MIQPVNRKFTRVLIANRGEIAVRVIRALRELEIESVAVYSDADSESMHRFLADYAVPLRGNTSAETYLDIAKILHAAKISGAQAIYPGYGFLSENAQFAAEVGKAGLVFIGPSPLSMEIMGDKIQARNCVTAAGVPTVPGSSKPLANVEELRQLASKFGYPLILKAAAGGGGRGMRVVRQDTELEPSFEACTREAKAYFGNPEVFCERYIEAGRHIEFQVIADSHGNTVHLYDRDCTVQRRHQKLIEEGPSTFLTSSQREKLGEIATAAARSAKYVGAGTIEFICESPERCYFMEMNTRIQVEHCVTEMITGIDLVREQILVAQGHALSFTQKDIQIRGAAIEVRINAEDPSRDFAPTPGLISEMRLPSGPFTRVDSHIYPGYVVPEFYDSMIAKLIVHGRDRTDAIAKLLRALSELRIVGIATTSAFLEIVCRDEIFVRSEHNTRYVETHMKRLMDKINESKSDSAEEAELLALRAAIAWGDSRMSVSTNQSASSNTNATDLWQNRSRSQAVGRGWE